MNQIDLNYRPISYFWALEKGIHLTSNIMGAERKAIFERLLEEDRADEINDLISKPVLNDEERVQIGRIHPAFMGGEYLPRLRENEVEIARITLATTTQDVACVYAKKFKTRIHYRVVDEYNGSTIEGKYRRTSKHPLTLNQLANFFLTAWDLIATLEHNFAEYGYPRREINKFIVDVNSSYYAEFNKLIRERVDIWLNSKPCKDNSNTTEE